MRLSKEPTSCPLSDDASRSRKKGREIVGLCPFHKEKNPSFTVVPSKGFYKCFGCGESGDVADFIMKHDSKTFPESLEIIKQESGLSGGQLIPQPKIVEAPIDPQIIPVPDWAPMPSFVHSRHGAPSVVYTYSDEHGKTIGHICRYDPPGERKQMSWLSFRARAGWVWRGFDTPRPMYGLDMLAKIATRLSLSSRERKLATSYSSIFRGELPCRGRAVLTG